MSKALESKISVEIIQPDQWPRLRVLRLKSLQVNPEAFGGTYELESAEDESVWREKFTKLDFLIASVDGVDAALMSVEKLDGDFGATCWIGGCWSDPDHRGSTRQPGKFHQRMIRKSEN